MALKTPIKATFSGSNVVGLAEFTSSDFIGVTSGGIGTNTLTSNSILLGNGTDAIQSSSLQILGSTLSSSDSSIITIDDGLNISGALSVTGNTIITGNLTVNGTTTTINSTTIDLGNQFKFEGTTSDDFETILTAIDPTADRTISLPNVSGTVLTTGNITDITGLSNSQLSNSSFTLTDDTSSTTTISLGETLKISGDTGITTSVSGDNINIDLDDTAVTPNTYGSSTAIPVITIDQQGRITSASTQNISTTLTISDDTSSTVDITLGSDTLKVSGTSNEIETSILGDTITIGLPSNVTIGNQLKISGANSTADGTGQIFLNGSTGNRIDWNSNGTAAPSFTTRSVGTKLTLFPALGASAVDYGIGINAGTLWNSIPGNDGGQFFKWYGGETEVASLSGVGNLILTGDLQVKGGDITTDQTTFNLLNTTATTLNIGGAATTVSIGAVTGTATINNAEVVIAGNLTVNGTTTTINSTTLNVDDKNIELASVLTPTDVTADGAGITIKGTTDKTFNWLDATDSFTSSEHIDLASGKVFKINNSTVLSSTEVLGKSVPSGTIVGTSDSQTLTNKTISGSSNTLSNIDNSSLTNSFITLSDDTSSTTTISLGETLKISGDTGITTTISGDTVNIDLDDTAVSPGSYGSSTAVPVIAVDQQGRITSVSTQNISTTLTISDDSSTLANINLGSDTLKISGTANEIETSISGDTIIVGLPNNVTVAGTLDVNGASTLKGSITLGQNSGDSTEDSITVNARFISNLEPLHNITYDLGSPNRRWRDLYLSGNTIDLNGATISGDGSGNITISATGAVLPVGSQVGTQSIATADANTGISTRLVPFYTNALGLSTAATNLVFKSGNETGQLVFTDFTISNGQNIVNYNSGGTLFAF